MLAMEMLAASGSLVSCTPVVTVGCMLHVGLLCWRGCVLDVGDSRAP